MHAEARWRYLADGQTDAVDADKALVQDILHQDASCTLLNHT